MNKEEKIKMVILVTFVHFNFVILTR